MIVSATTRLRNGPMAQDQRPRSPVTGATPGPGGRGAIESSCPTKNAARPTRGPRLRGPDQNGDTALSSPIRPPGGHCCSDRRASLRSSPRTPVGPRRGDRMFVRNEKWLAYVRGGAAFCFAVSHSCGRSRRAARSGLAGRRCGAVSVSLGRSMRLPRGLRNAYRRSRPVRRRTAAR
jgi:hypothetical protein